MKSCRLRVEKLINEMQDKSEAKKMEVNWPCVVLPGSLNANGLQVYQLQMQLQQGK